MNNDSIIEAFEDSIKGNLNDIKKDSIQALSNQLLDESLKDIPYVKYIFTLKDFFTNLKDYLDTRKVLQVLFHLQEVSANQREEVINRIESDNEYQTKVGEKLMFIIDKADDIDKADLIGKLVLELVRENIKYDEFLRLSHAVNSIFIDDIRLFLKIQHSNLENVNKGVTVTSGLFTLNQAIETFKIYNLLSEKSPKILSSGGQIRELKMTPIGFKFRTLLQDKDSTHSNGYF